MTLLDEIIDGASSDAVSTSNLLRKVRTVASRLEATEVLTWVTNESDGYQGIEGLPSYRVLHTAVMGTWNSFRMSVEGFIEAGRIPEDAAEVLFTTHMTGPVRELEQHAASENDLGHSWDGSQVVLYNHWVSQGLVSGVSDSKLFEAHRVITRAAVGGMLDTIRNKALDLALELQKVSPEAGSQGGPTVADPPVAHTIMNFHNTIHGNVAALAQGKSVTQTTTVNVGDLGSLLTAAAEAGLTAPADVAELVEAVLAPESERQGRVRAFLTRVGAGTYAVALGISAEVAASRLEPLIHAYLGW